MKRARKLLLWLVSTAVAGTIISSAAQPTNAVSEVESLGGSVRLLAVGGKEIEVDFQFSGTALKDEHLSVLSSFQNLSVLRLKNTGITDAGLGYVAKVTTLKRIDLSGTSINDAGLSNLANLKALESLNLFGTAVTDLGLDVVKEWPALKQLFIWQTKVSADGIARLKQAKPNLRVMPDPAADQEQARAILDTTVATLTRAQKAVEPVKKQAAEVIANAERVKKESDDLIKRAEKNPEDSALRKQADAQKQTVEEATKKADKAKDAVATAEVAVVSARQQVEEARRDLAKLSVQSASVTNQIVKP